MVGVESCDKPLFAPFSAVYPQRSIICTMRVCGHLLMFSVFQFMHAFYRKRVQNVYIESFGFIKRNYVSLISSYIIEYRCITQRLRQEIVCFFKDGS